jgi:hypothetical protein
VLSWSFGISTPSRQPGEIHILVTAQDIDLGVLEPELVQPAVKDPPQGPHLVLILPRGDIVQWTSLLCLPDLGAIRF